METLLQLLKKTIAFFESKAVDAPKLSAEHLFAHVLGCKRLDLYLRFEERLPEEVVMKLREAVKRRGNHEPLQYIIGDVEFYGVKLKTDKRALIPRPETEELIELLIKEYGGRAPHSILDLGTGTGAIAITLARAFPEAKVVAVDISEDALSLAEENIRLNGLGGRIGLIKSSWFSGVKGKFDWIISNPPYLTEEEYEAAAEQVQKFEPKLALTSGDEGMNAIREILGHFRDYLNDGGLLALETGIGQHGIIQELIPERLSLKDTLSRDRFIIINK